MSTTRSPYCIWRWADSTAAHLETRLEAGDDWQTEFDQVTADLRAAVRRPDRGIRTDLRRLARRLAHLTFARKRFIEAHDHYLTAAAHAADAVELYDDLRDAADATLVVADGTESYHLMLRAAERAAAENNHELQQEALAQAVMIVNRYEVEPPLPADRGASLLAADADTVCSPHRPGLGGPLRDRSRPRPPSPRHVSPGIRWPS